MPGPHEATPHLTPDEWDALGKGELWRNWAEPGHLHNLLDYWADDLRQLKAERDAMERLLRLTLAKVGFHPDIIDSIITEALQS